MENMYLTRKVIRKLPGTIMKTIPMPEPEIIEGFGCRIQIGRVCRESGFDAVLILTDKRLCNLGYLKSVEKALETEGISYKVFDGIITEPRLEYIETGRAIAMEIGAKCIITIGGGSVMDTGKMVASGCRLRHLSADMLLQKFLIVPEKSLPIIAVPSTAGTGAEVTVGAVITQRNGGKFALCDLDLDGSIVVPEDFKELSIAVAKDSVNYSAPMTFPRRQILSILSEINKQK